MKPPVIRLIRVSAFRNLSTMCNSVSHVDRSFEDHLEVLLQRLKEYQTIGKRPYFLVHRTIEFDLVFSSVEEPRSKHVASLKKQIAQVRRTITKNISSSSLNNNPDDSLQQRTANDESSERPERNPFVFKSEYCLAVETISSLSPNVSSLNVTRNQSELVDPSSINQM